MKLDSRHRPGILARIEPHAMAVLLKLQIAPRQENNSLSMEETGRERENITVSKCEAKEFSVDYETSLKGPPIPL